nr:40S ribosomal protein S13 [Tanacetum cinerariifolium]
RTIARPLLSISAGTFTTPDWLPDGWTVVVLAKATRRKYKEGIYEIFPVVVDHHCYFLISSDPETSVMAHIPKPPTPLKPKPKPKPKPKMKKKKIKITWSSYNYHGSYPMNKDEQKIWNLFIVTDKAEANKHEQYPYEKHLHTVDDVMVVDILGKFAVNTFNKSCKLYVNKDEDNLVSGAEFMECKFFKLTLKYIFYMTIEAIEHGIRGVYETRVECVTENGKMTLQNFVLTEREPK